MKKKKKKKKKKNVHVKKGEKYWKLKHEKRGGRGVKKKKKSEQIFQDCKILGVQCDI